MVALRVAIQMDPIDAIDINGDTSFRLALEAQNRGHSVYVYKPEDLVAHSTELDLRTQQ